MAMNCHNVEDIVKLIARRDGISIEEAYACVMDCQTELDYVVARGGSYDEVVEVIADILGLEPDYMDILLDNML